MDRSIGSPRTRSVVGVRGPGVSVFGLPLIRSDVWPPVSKLIARNDARDRDFCFTI